MIFLFPLALSVIGVLFFLTADVEWKWKILAALLVVVALVLQFVPALDVHFLVPLAIQIVV
ncbi:MAG: hypothetical protein EXS05_07180 [Planctomycetaceae bacterium]|nr:hypothetical protein [Planctomycetaceae bacterium]